MDKSGTSKYVSYSIICIKDFPLPSPIAVLTAVPIVFIAYKAVLSANLSWPWPLSHNKKVVELFPLFSKKPPKASDLTGSYCWPSRELVLQYIVLWQWKERKQSQTRHYPGTSTWWKLVTCLKASCGHTWLLLNLMLTWFISYLWLEKPTKKDGVLLRVFLCFTDTNSCPASSTIFHKSTILEEQSEPDGEGGQI